MIRTWNSSMRGGLTVIVSALLAPGALSAEEVWTEFTFSKMNTVFERSEADVAWSVDGPVAIEVISPEHRLEVFEHSLRLTPEGNGLYRSRTRVRFAGEGDIHATVDVLGSEGDLTDHVVVPEQGVEVEATLRLVPLPDGNVQVFAVRLPEAVTVEIESGLGTRLYLVCNLTLAILAGVDCSLLEAAFTTARVPLPEPGSSTTLTADQMTQVEAARLRGYLEATRGLLPDAAAAGG